MYRLIATDLDGTLLQNGVRTVRQDLFPLIHEYSKCGGVFLPASGRQYKNLQNLFEPVKDEIAYICENGCLVFYRDELLYKADMDRKQGEKLIEAIRELDGCEVLVSGVHTCYVDSNSPNFYRYINDHVKNVTTMIDDLCDTPESFFKISAYHPGGTHLFEDKLKREFGHELNVVTSGNCWLDVMPKGIHKGSAIMVLSEALDIALEDMVALGDHYNDYEILKLVGHPACVDNAMPEIKELCERQMESGADLLAKYLVE